MLDEKREDRVKVSWIIYEGAPLPAHYQPTNLIYLSSKHFSKSLERKKVVCP